MKSKQQHKILQLGAACMLAGYFASATAELQIQKNESGSGAVIVNAAREESRLNTGYAYLESGSFQQALREFDLALAEARERGDLAMEAKIRNAAGYASFLEQRGKTLDIEETRRNMQPALDQLKLALVLASKSRDANLEGWTRVSLGLVYTELDETERAADEFGRGAALGRATGDVALESSAELQMIRLDPSAPTRLDKLQGVATKVADSPLDDRTKANLLLNVLDQLKPLQDDGEGGSSSRIRELGHRLSAQAAGLAAKTASPRILSQVEGYQANLYAQEGKTDEAIRLTEQAIRHGDTAMAPDLTMLWESQLGSLLAGQGKEEQAIGAYRRAAFHVSEVRNNIPIYQNGESTYQEILEPIYRNLTDLLLRFANRANSAETRQNLLMESIQSLEQLKQSELEDYFNDRCAFGSTSPPIGTTSKTASSQLLQSSQARERLTAIAAIVNRAKGPTAILYPVLLDDRLELLLAHDGAIRQKTVAATGEQVTEQAEKLAAILRAGRDYRVPSRQLYQWLVAPFRKELQSAGIQRLVYVPDGPLRLVPLSVLSDDGKDFMVRHFVVTTNIGVQNAPTAVGKGEVKNALLAGVSKPSESLLNDADLPDSLLASLGRPRTRALGNGEEQGPEPEMNVSRVRAMRNSPEFRSAAVESLALPEVESEINAVHRALPSDPPLLNENFTKANLAKGFQSGKYQLAHISTHSYFGHSASDSFIVAYDEILKVNEIENIMKAPKGMRQPVELVTFSACETAHGDDRAPLGFTGLAIKGKIRNAIGSLWNINDRATRLFMEKYYSAMAETGGDKAKALQIAQLGMLSDKDRNLKLYHPTNWAPFILVGEW